MARYPPEDRRRLMPPDRIRLEACGACGTAYPAEEARCPECGAPRPGARPRPAPEDPPAGIEDLFAAFGPAPGGQPASPRSAFGPLARHFLGRNVGCLTWALVLFFGVPLAVGALAGDALGGLAWALLAVGVAGLAMTAWLVWLVRTPRR